MRLQHYMFILDSEHRATHPINIYQLNDSIAKYGENHQTKLLHAHKRATVDLHLCSEMGNFAPFL